MPALKAMVEDLGFDDVRTLLQSGNVVFRGGTTSKLEQQLEGAARKTLHLDTEFIVRTAAQWEKIVAGNPFPKEARNDPGHLLLMACKQASGKDLKVTGAKSEVVKPAGKEIYIYYPAGVGRSRLKVHTVGTARNWNTVLKLQALTKA
jgi:uncharacterized protein (DUF1697 family)